MARPQSRGILGFALGFILDEVTLANKRETEGAIAVVILIVLGVVAGSWLARRFANRSAKPF